MTIPFTREPDGVDNLEASLDRIAVRIDALLRQQDHICDVLSTFYRSDVSMGSLQAVLDLCVELMPALKTEPR